MEASRAWLSLHFDKLKQRLLEADKPPWLISTAVHMVIVLILALFTFNNPERRPRVIHVSIADAQSVVQPLAMHLVLAEPELPEKVQRESEQTDPAVVSSASITDALVMMETKPWAAPSVPQLSVIDTRALSLASATVDTANVSVSHPMADMSSDRLNPESSNLHSASALSEAMFAGRSGEAKIKLLKEGGGTPETEAAVALGLAWLKRQQHSDGSWRLTGPYPDGSGVENQTAATAMAMMAFMGAGNTHRYGEYRDVMARALRWLLARQDASGWMASGSDSLQGMYAQSQATIAICELYAMTKETQLERYAQRACNFACSAQSPQGGWRYRARFDSDTSVSGWFLVGLKSGEAAGLDIDSKTFPEVITYLDSVGGDHYTGGYSYQAGMPPSPSMTAVGLLCRQYLGWHRNMPGMRSGLATLVTNHPLDTSAPDVYYWYYATQAIHHYGGPLWTQWNDRMKVQLPASQEKVGAQRGSWSPTRDAWGRHAGRLYTTCLSVYCLEVYYRHMPIYDRDDQTP